MKKLLLLGGLRYLLPVIKTAKEMGYYVITCDYLPDNIAHKYSDEYHNVSIIDKEAVLALAQSLQVQGVMSFAVDPGVVTAAYVSEKMGLSSPGPYTSIQILQHKGLFRKFLEEHNFNVPKSNSYVSVEQALDNIEVGDLPVIVKPVDAAGSKGVTKVTVLKELEMAINYALSASPTKSFIIEEFLESKGFSSDTDCFSINGQLSYVSFSSQRFDPNSPNPYTPSAYSWPSSISLENQNYLKKELQRLVGLLEMRSSVYNIEVRETVDGRAYIMEVSPRGGGNRLSEMLNYATGTDLIRRAVQATLGEQVDEISQPNYVGNWAEIMLHSNTTGVFKGLDIDASISINIVEVDLWVEEGDAIKAFSGANDAIGTLVLRFKTQNELESVLSDHSKFIKVIVES